MFLLSLIPSTYFYFYFFSKNDLKIKTNRLVLVVDAYLAFLEKLRHRRGLDLGGYKRPQMERRINSLMRMVGAKDYDDYLLILEKDQEQWHKFLDTITINVSEFYRNPPQWEVLIKTIIPMLIENVGVRFRAWSAGCSTGEEPYTLAMVLDHNFPQLNYSILATDIDEDALAKARVGEYSERSLAGLPQIYIKKYFEVENGIYRLKDSIKKKVQFKKHNLLRDPFESGFDLILCRNVVIYFTEESKNELYRKFHQSLKPGGVLFIGSTEQIFEAQEIGFELVTSFFYQKRMDRNSKSFLRGSKPFLSR